MQLPVPTAAARDEDFESLKLQIADRFGLVPSFFLLASVEPAIVRAQFEMATFAYFDCPLPSVFKERLFSYVSRFCAVPYCMARHCGFLVGLGHVAGDADASAIQVAEVVSMLERPLPTASQRDAILLELAAASPLDEWPHAGSPLEEAIFMAAAIVFVSPMEARPIIGELRRVLGRSRNEYLMLFLGFIRFAHFWTEAHPDLRFENDLDALLAEQRLLAAWISGYQAVVSQELQTTVDRDLHELGRLRETVAHLNADVSDLRQELHATAKAANASADAKVNFIATVSHELRTPLNAVIGYADLLQAGAGGPLSPDAAKFVERIRLTARHQRELIEDILRYSSLEAEQDLVTIASVSLDALVAEITAVIAPLANAKGLQLMIELADGSRTIHTDPGKIRQIFLNLLGNGVKFTAAGQVTLRLECRQNHLIGIVSDTGPGIPPERRDYIFEPFTQLDVKVTRAYGGTGLGLAIVHRLLVLLNGTISIADNQPTGTVFTVTLPLAAAPDEAA